MYEYMLHYIFNYIHKIEFSFTYIHFCVVQRSVFIGQTFSIAPLTDKPRSRSLNICPLHGHNIACINEVLCRNVKNLTLSVALKWLVLRRWDPAKRERTRNSVYRFIYTGLPPTIDSPQSCFLFSTTAPVFLWFTSIHF